MKKKWKDYAIYLESWEAKWTELSTFFEYPESVRKIIYTNNPLERKPASSAKKSNENNDNFSS